MPFSTSPKNYGITLKLFINLSFRFWERRRANHVTPPPFEKFLDPPLQTHPMQIPGCAHAVEITHGESRNLTHSPRSHIQIIATATSNYILMRHAQDFETRKVAVNPSGVGVTQSTDWLIDWLKFNGTFSTVRLHRAFRSYSLRCGEQKHPGNLVHLVFSSGWPAT